MKPFSGYNLNQLEKDGLTKWHYSRQDQIYNWLSQVTNQTEMWVKFLQRKDAIDVQNGGVCEKHFLNSDFLDDPVKRTGQTRVNRLKQGVVSNVFDSYPAYAKHQPMKGRTTQMTSSQARLNSDNQFLKMKVDKFVDEKILYLDDFHKKFSNAQLPNGYR